ncbi:stathmin family protein [Acinetobacter sp. ANC 7200]|uniref:stathmin family protein n=1 Tax=Acinetobacter amyesii TaxID=2942470 RepID=UPI0020C0AD7B|nr:stathmin family protein [Acinetobacter amyesii]MCL6243379.1 stathmin family protein [Acinetobacter amyesii]
MPEAEKPNQYCFQLGQLSVDNAEEGKKKRTFSGVAYSGEPITDHWYWDRIIFDLDSMQLKGRIPALLEHRSSQRAGAINTHSINHQTGLTVSGDLMSNEFGAQVAQDSDDGFPWQMSVRIEPTAIEEIQAGASVSVNGKVHQGPITVFRGGRIREVSFCALGADDNTNAVAASHSPKNFNQPEDTDVTELEQTQAKLKQAETDRDAAQAELKKFKADKREEDIKSLETAMNKQFSAEEKKSYTDMDDSAFAFMSQQLKQFSAGNQQSAVQQQQPAPGVNPAFAHLFTHQANSNQSGQQGQGDQQGTALDHAFNQFAAAQQGAKK